jgi:kynurenine formamidase
MANFAGAERVRAGAATVSRGAVFSLDYALNAFDPPMAKSRRAPHHEITSSHAQSRDDVLRHFYPQASTQIDGLRHRRASGHGFYNGVPDEAITVGSPTLGVQRWAERPIVGRGLLLDLDGLTAAAGTPLDHRAGPALPTTLLDEAIRTQGVAVEPGDLLLVHTGWARWYLDTDPTVQAELRDARRSTGFAQRREFLAWLWDHQIGLFATDTYAVEVLPPLPDSDFAQSAPEDNGMMHQELLAKLGVAMGELWNLTALTQDSRRTGRWDALVTVKPLHLVGGVGSPANALAIR